MDIKRKNENKVKFQELMQKRINNTYFSMANSHQTKETDELEDDYILSSFRIKI